MENKNIKMNKKLIKTFEGFNESYIKNPYNDETNRMDNYIKNFDEFILENFSEKMINEAFQSTILQTIFAASDSKGKKIIQKLASEKDIALNQINDRNIKYRYFEYNAKYPNHSHKDIKSFKNDALEGSFTLFTINDKLKGVVYNPEYTDRGKMKLVYPNMKGIKKNDLNKFLTAMNTEGAKAYNFPVADYQSGDSHVHTRQKVANQHIKVPDEIKLTQAEKLEIYKGLKGTGDVGILTMIKSVKAENSGDRIDAASFLKSVNSMIEPILKEVNSNNLLENSLNLKPEDVQLGVEGDQVYMSMRFHKNNNSKSKEHSKYDYSQDGYHEGKISVNLTNPKENFGMKRPKIIYGSKTSETFFGYELSFYKASGMKTRRKYTGEIKKWRNKFPKSPAVKNIVKFILDNKARLEGRDDWVSKVKANAKPYEEALLTVVSKIMRRKEDELGIYSTRGYRGTPSDWAKVYILPLSSSGEHAIFRISAGLSSKGRKLSKKSLPDIVDELNGVLGGNAVEKGDGTIIINTNMKISDLTQ